MVRIVGSSKTYKGVPLSSANSAISIFEIVKWPVGVTFAPIGKISICFFEASSRYPVKFRSPYMDSQIVSIEPGFALSIPSICVSRSSRILIKTSSLFLGDSIGLP